MSANRFKRLALVTAAALVAVVVPSSGVGASEGAGQKKLFKANMSGAQEVPGPGDEDGRGKALVRIKPSEGEVCFTLSWRDIATPTRAHIHVGAKGVAGGIVVTLFEGTPVEQGCVPGDETVLNAIKDNPRGYYVNIHNADFPAGAIRGQLKKSGRHFGNRFFRTGDGASASERGDCDRARHREGQRS